MELGGMETGLIVAAWGRGVTFKPKGAVALMGMAWVAMERGAVCEVGLDEEGPMGRERPGYSELQLYCDICRDFCLYIKLTPPKKPTCKLRSREFDV